MRVVPAVVIAVVIATVAAGTGGAVPAAIDRTVADDATTVTTDAAAANHTNVSFGAQLSSFMQSNAAQASGSVETGMWVAAFENATNDSRPALVERRTDQLAQRIAELRAEKRALQAAKRNGSISGVEYRSRLSRIVGQLAALNEGIDAVNRSDAPGLNRTSVAALARQADRLAGPEISDVARSLGGPGAAPGPPEWVEAGPDVDAANGSNGGGQGEGPPSNASAPDDTGPPADAGNGTANGGGNAGNGSDAGGQGKDGGQGNDGDDNPRKGNGGNNGVRAADVSSF